MRITRIQFAGRWCPIAAPLSPAKQCGVNRHMFGVNRHIA